MRKSSLTYAFGFVAITGRITYLFVQQKQDTGDGNLVFQTATAPTSQDDIYMVDPVQRYQRAFDDKAKELRADFQKEQGELHDAAQGLSQADFDVTSLNLNQGLHDVTLLTQLYQESPTDQLAALLLYYYQQELMFDDARAIIETHPSLLGQLISRQEAMQLYANTNALNVTNEQSIAKLQKKVQERSSQEKISSDDKQRYDALALLWMGDVQGFYDKAIQVKGDYYVTVIEGLQQDTTYVQSQKGVPEYYQKALFGLTLLQHQYITVAEKVAIDVSIQDPNYILPYQILAYTTFLQQRRESSTAYIRELFARDETHKDMYQFMLGVIAYRQDKNQEAVLYFIGIQDQDLVADAQRYLTLLYSKMGDDVQSAVNFDKLLTQGELTPSDYYNYFYRAYFHPYRSNTSYVLLETDRTLALRYHSACEKTIPLQWQYICDYGEVGQLLYNGQTDNAYKRLLYLAKYYPQSYFYQALGDHAHKQGKTDDAIMYYVQALSYTKDSIENIAIRGQIKDLLPSR